MLHLWSSREVEMSTLPVEAREWRQHDSTASPVKPGLTCSPSFPPHMCSVSFTSSLFSYPIRLLYDFTGMRPSFHFYTSILLQILQTGAGAIGCLPSLVVTLCCDQVSSSALAVLLLQVLSSAIVLSISFILDDTVSLPIRLSQLYLALLKTWS